MARTGPFDRRPAEYDRWFDEHRAVYLLELDAVRALLPAHSRSMEVGVGTGRFAQPLGIALGVEPSAAMRDISRSRGIEVVDAVAEDLPFSDASFDLVLIVTTICFMDDVDRALKEAHRVLSAGGHIVVGFLDRETELGRRYEARKSDSEFYSQARFYSSAEVLDALERAGFGELASAQTVFNSATDSQEGPPRVESGHGAGLFVVVRGCKMAGDARAPN